MENSIELIGFLEAGITPVALISGVGLLLLTLNNRLGRTVDRTRMLIQRLETKEAIDEEISISQLKILYRRSKILQSSIASIAFSVLTSSLIIIVLLIMNFIPLDLSVLGKVLFVLSVSGIVASAIFLFIDVALTLKALKLEVSAHLEK